MENPFFGDIGREWIRVVKNEALESILNRSSCTNRRKMA